MRPRLCVRCLVRRSVMLVLSWLTWLKMFFSEYFLCHLHPFVSLSVIYQKRTHHCPIGLVLFLIILVLTSYYVFFDFFSENKDDVLKNLMDLVMDVEPQLHKNQKHFL